VTELGLTTNTWAETFTQVGFDYRWHIPGSPLIFRTLDIAYRFGQVRAHIAIDAYEAPPKSETQREAVGTTVRVYADTIPVRDGQARKRFSDTVMARSGNRFQHFHFKMDWFCARVDQAERVQGGDPRLVTGEAQSMMAQHLIDPLVVDFKPTWLLAPGGTGKSWVGTAVCVCLAAGIPFGKMECQHAEALYLDWEDDEAVFRERLYMLSRGLGVPNQAVHYRHMTGPLRNYIRNLAAYIAKHEIRLVVLDSVGMAMSGYEGGFEDMALALHADLRALGCAVLALDHVSGEDVSSGVVSTKAYGCFSADTEVLTRSGWKTHPQLAAGEEVLAYDKERGVLEWQTPEHYWEYDYDGPMYRLSGKQVAALVTPNHRLLLRGRKQQAYRFVEAQNLTSQDWAIPAAADTPDQPDVEWFKIVPGYQFPMDTWLRFLGWMISEGSTQRGRMRLAQVLGAVESMMVDTVRELGFSYWRQERDTPAQTLGQIVINNTPDLTRWYEENTGLRSGDKRLPEFVWGLSRRQRGILLRALLDGDGNRRDSGLAQYTTKSRQLADDVQRLMVLAGRRTTLRGYTTPYKGEPYTYYRVTQFPADTREVTLTPNTQVSVESYRGKVYCLTVPSSAYLTRLHGVVGIYGNSVYKMNLARLAWSVKAEEPYGPRLRIGLFNVKANWGMKRKPIGLEFDFSNQEQVSIGTFDVRESPELARALPKREQIVGVLKNGPRDIEEIAEETSIKKGTVKSLLLNGRRHGIFVLLDTGCWANQHERIPQPDAPVPW
jgi:hypothetical protein